MGQGHQQCRPRWRRGWRPAWVQLADWTIRVWRRNRHPGQCSRRHFRTMEIFQSLVRHPAGRAGYAMNNILLFATGGLAYGNLKAEAFGIDENKTLVGWTAGLGMEVGFTPNWSAKVEYLYMDLGSRFYTVTGTDNGLQASYLRFGVNYHF